jgi:cyclase
MKRFLLATVFGGLGALSLFLTRGDAQPNTVKQIAPGVWFREGDIQQQGHCNNIIIEMKDYLIIVDAKYVFDTHHHGDHAYGNPVMTKAGAITLAYVGVAEEMKRYEPSRWRDTAKQRKDVGELNLDAPEPPKETFSKSPHVISDGTRRVEFHFFGWAHTRGDGFVYLPKEKVLCTGDAVANGPYNYTADGNIGNWPSVIAKAQKLSVEHVLPGHGPAGGKEVLEAQRMFFVELNKRVGDAIKQGQKLDDIVKMDGARALSTTISMPDSVKKYVAAGFPGIVLGTYNEITQKKASGDLPH